VCEYCGDKKPQENRGQDQTRRCEVRRWGRIVTLDPAATESESRQIRSPSPPCDPPLSPSPNTKPAKRPRIRKRNHPKSGSRPRSTPARQNAISTNPSIIPPSLTATPALHTAALNTLDDPGGLELFMAGLSSAQRFASAPQATTRGPEGVDSSPWISPSSKTRPPSRMSCIPSMRDPPKLSNFLALRTLPVVTQVLPRYLPRTVFSTFPRWPTSPP
jgi:hypothetical protein